MSGKVETLVYSSYNIHTTAQYCYIFYTVFGWTYKSLFMSRKGIRETNHKGSEWEDYGREGIMTQQRSKQMVLQPKNGSERIEGLLCLKWMLSDALKIRITCT